MNARNSVSKRSEIVFGHKHRVGLIRIKEMAFLFTDVSKSREFKITDQRERRDENLAFATK